jgi:hypothetical protein
VSENGMAALFERKKPEDLEWLLIDYIQTCVKDNFGVG